MNSRQIIGILKAQEKEEKEIKESQVREYAGKLINREPIVDQAKVNNSGKIHYAECVELWFLYKGCERVK